MADSLMDQAQRALWEERNEDAQAILINVIAREPEHEEAWMLLAEAMADARKKRECLERARAINPRNRAILRALERLAIESPPESPPSPEAAAADSPPLEPSAEPTPAAAPERSVGPLLFQGSALAQSLLLSVEPGETRQMGADLLQVLDEAAADDPETTRRWTRSAGRDALLKFEKALTAQIAALPRDDPQLSQRREQRRRALSYLR